MHFRLSLATPPRSRALRARRCAVAALISLPLLASGCTSHAKASHTPSAPASASSADAAAALAALAQRARAASYTASYLAQSSDNPPHTNTIKVFRTPQRTRLDVLETADHVIIQVDPTGTYTCKVPASGQPSCITLAGPSQSVPSNVNPSGQELFTTTLDVLAGGNDLTVAPAPAQASTSAVPAAQCYAVIAAPAGEASPGTYCFTDTGVVARAQFRSNVLQLTAVGSQPTDADFKLPATPVPLATSSKS